MSDPFADLKRRAAVAAVAQVRSGMRLGLGTGSTSAFAIDALGRRFQAGEVRDIAGVPTSRRTAELATRYGIPLLTLAEAPHLDLAIDGADEVDPRCNLTKGAGGALLLEKEVERHAARLIIIVDSTKLVAKLGTRCALPVEVAPGSWESARDAVARLGCSTNLRTDGQGPFVTDRGNFIIDCRFHDGIDDPRALAAVLEGCENIRAHGLFLGMATEVIVAEAGGVRSILPS